jgi:uncharacterized cupin superfamily protein
MNEKSSLLSARLIRNFNESAMESFVRAPLYESMGVRLGTDTAAVKLGASIDIVPPGKRSCPYHYHHAQEEMFIVIEGTGTLRVAGEMLPLKVGDVVFIPAGPEYPHQILNTSNEPLKYLSISTRESPEICVYPDSGKYQAIAYTNGSPSVRVVQREDSTLDYWDGEP